MHDPDIRKALLAEAAGWHGASFVLQEMQIGGFRSYVDVAAIGDDLHAYEIKSEFDSLTRLRTQVPHYDSVCDFSTLVTTARHAGKARDILPLHWGILVADEREGELFFTIKRPATRNQNRSTVKLLEILTRRELVSALKINGFSASGSGLHKLAAVDTTFDFLGERNAKMLALNVLRTRTTWTNRQLGVGTDDERIAHARRQESPFICFTTNQMW